MLYLEDYLELIEQVPQELRDRLTDVREMDLHVQNCTDSLDDRQKEYFANARKLKPEQRQAEFESIRQEYYKILEDADEKVQIANQVYEMIEKYLRRLDQEIQKFKMELEADNAGITEILEKRSLEMDLHPHSSNNQPKAEKRRYSTFQTNSIPPVIAEKRPMLDKPVPSLPQEMVAPEPAKPVIPRVPVSSGISSPFSATVLPSPAVSYSLGQIGPGSNVIAAAASQAIAATQQVLSSSSFTTMSQGRRTASLKASIEAVNAGIPTIREFSIGKDLATNAGLLPSGSPTSPYGHDTSRSGRPRKQSTRLPQSQPQVAVAPPVQVIPQQQQQQQQLVHQQDPLAMSQDDCFIEGVVLDEAQPDWTYDPNEPRYCICNQVSYGDMVACDNEDCPFEWFHYPCVGITQPPKGKWYCPQCLSSMRRRGRKEK